MDKIRLFSMQRSLTAKKAFVAIFLVVFLFLTLPHVGLAQTTGADTFGINDAQVSGLANVELKDLIRRIISIVLGFLGLVLVLIILYGGFIWMTSNGDPAKVEKAKKILKNSVIGLIIVLSAYSIVAFVLRSGSGGSGSGTPGTTPGEPLCIGCIGGGPIESVFPTPNQTGVPINTWIAVTFKENIDPASICESLSEGICKNSKMKNVEICQLDDKGLCVSSGDFTVDALANTTVLQRAGDNKTFVFSPNKYLGFEDKINREFKVQLRDDIKRSSDGKSIFSGYREYDWQFTTNGELDLDPPEVVSTNSVLNPVGIANISGVYPEYDNSPDTYKALAAATVGKSVLTINSQPVIDQPLAVNGEAVVGQTSVAIQPDGGSYSGVEVALETSGFTVGNSGKVTVTVSGSSATISLDNADIFSVKNAISISNNQIVFIDNNGNNLGLALVSKNGSFPQGSRWTFDITKPADGQAISFSDFDSDDYIYNFVFVAASDTRSIVSKKVGDSTVAYQAVKLGTNVDGTAASLAAAINATSFGKVVSANASGETVTVSSRSVGLAEIKISLPDSISANPSSVQGSNIKESQTQVGELDAYRNTVFQINFNEAINPVYVDSLMVKYDKNGNSSSDTVITPNIKITNQYRTLELTGPIECGVNACGDKIYCWPINDIIAANPTAYDSKATKYEITLNAASLKPCDDGSFCSQWGGSCTTNNLCAKTVVTRTVFYPGVNLNNVNGFLDMAGNSFNGSFNYYTDPTNNKVYGIANGPLSNYYLNDKKYAPIDPVVSGDGDNFQWSFFISDKIDLQSPLIKAFNPQQGEEITGVFQSAQFTFDRVMRFSTLKPGWNYGEITDTKERSKRFLVMKTLTDGGRGVGYWVNSSNGDSNGDGTADYTISSVDHTKFDLFYQYGSLGGSGLESITQNCFLPGAGPKDADTAANICHYENDDPNTSNTTGCVTDSSITASERVHLPNPASYSKWRCEQIDDASVCPYETNGSKCKSLYDDTVSGSWVLTADYPTIVTSQNSCCLGKCK